MPVLSLFLAACNTESPLSGTEITDPSILTVQFTVNKSKVLSTGSSTYDFQASILDRKDRYIELVNGYVLLNGIRMVPQKVPFENTTRYRLYTDKIKFHLDSLYTFTVVLSDGVAYSSSIRTPATDMTSLTEVSSGDSVTFTWVGNAADSIEASYSSRGPDYGPGTSSLGYVRKKDPQGLNQARFGFTPGHAFDTTRYSITTFRRSPVNPAFRRGWAKSSIELTRD